MHEPKAFYVYCACRYMRIHWYFLFHFLNKHNGLRYLKSFLELDILYLWNDRFLLVSIWLCVHICFMSFACTNVFFLIMLNWIAKSIDIFVHVTYCSHHYVCLHVTSPIHFLDLGWVKGILHCFLCHHYSITYKSSMCLV